MLRCLTAIILISGTLPLYGNDYRCFARFLGQNDSNFSSVAIGDYANPGEFEIQNASDGQVIDVELRQADSLIQVCLTLVACGACHKHAQYSNQCQYGVAYSW